MQSVNFILCCANLHRMNEKLLLHGHCLFLRMPKQSFTTFGYSLLQNSVKPIQIKQKLRFFKADEYISRVFGLRLLNSIIFFFHTNSYWKNHVYMAMQEATVEISYNCSFTTLVILIVSFFFFCLFFRYN